jgi:hypothetical protein
MNLYEIIKDWLGKKKHQSPPIEAPVIDEKILDTSKILASVDQAVVGQIMYARGLSEAEKGLIAVCRQHYNGDYAKMIEEMKQQYSSSVNNGGGEWLAAIQNAEKLKEYEDKNKVSIWDSLSQYDAEFRAKYLAQPTPPKKQGGTSGLRAAAVF